MRWSEISANDVAKHFKTNLETGLPLRLIRKRSVTSKVTVDNTALKRILRIAVHQFMNPLIYLLLIAAIIAWSIGYYFDASFIFAILLFNALVGFIQEFRSDNAVRELRKIVPSTSRVVRNGRIVEVSTDSVVEGDIVVLYAGDKVPADMRLSFTESLEVSEAPLTGESMAVTKHSGVVSSSGNDTVIQPNIAYYGSLVTTGHGRGIALRVGQNVRFAKILKKANEHEETKTPLIKEIKSLARIIVYILLIIIAIVFTVSFIRQMPLQETLLFIISLFIAIVPEGLPIVLTIVLSVAAARMARKKVLVRQLTAADMLGNVDIVLSDKTGTITTGVMSVREAWTADGEYSAVAKNKQPCKNIICKIAEIGAIANNASVIFGLKNNKKSGDAVDIALLEFNNRINNHKSNNLKRIDEIAFSSNNKYMAVLVNNRGKKIIFIKGAPEIVLGKSKNLLAKSGAVLLRQKNKDSINAACKKYSQQGHKIIALAYKEVNSNTSKLFKKEINNLTFAGIVAIEDSPRKDILSTIHELKKGGIDVKLVTGDFAGTAYAIAKEVGIVTKKDFVVYGSKIDTLLATKRYDIINNAKIFARCSPENKLALVEFYQKQGKQVAMAGDGVNDAAAIKKADVGIALAGEGGEVARETSDVALLNNDIKVLAYGLQEGRTVWENLRKIVYFLISTNIAELAIIAGSFIMFLPNPFTAVQILWINVVTDTVSDEALAFEPPEFNIMHRHERKLVTKIVLRRTIIAAIWQSLFVIMFYIWALNNMNEGAASSVAFFAMVAMQIFNLLNARSLYNSVFARSRPNPWIFGAVIITTVMMFATVYYEPLTNILKLEPISINLVIVIILLSASIIPVIEFDKYLTRKK